MYYHTALNNFSTEKYYLKDLDDYIYQHPENAKKLFILKYLPVKIHPTKPVKIITEHRNLLLKIKHKAF